MPSLTYCDADVYTVSLAIRRLRLLDAFVVLSPLRFADFRCKGQRDRRRDPMRQPLEASQRDRIAAGLPFVESLARRVAA